MVLVNRNVAPSFNTIIEILQNDQIKIKIIRKYENTRIKIINRVRSFWSRSLRSGTLRSRSFGSEAKFGHFGLGHYGPGHFGRGHFCLYFRH